MKLIVFVTTTLLTTTALAMNENEPASVSPENEESVVVCFGDSITAGDYPTFLSELLPTATVINAGVGGNTTGQGLARMDEDVLQREPDFVLMLFGTNDSVLRQAKTYRTPLEAFEQNLRTMVERCRAHGAQPILGTLLPIMAEPYYTRHPKEYYEPEGGLEAILERYRQTTIRVGKELKVPVVDFYEKIAGDLSMLKPDGVHPNEAGLRAIAAHFAEALAQHTPTAAEAEE